jgi:hypothetical protein
MVIYPEDEDISNYRKAGRIRGQSSPLGSVSKYCQFSGGVTTFYFHLTTVDTSSAGSDVPYELPPTPALTSVPTRVRAPR